MLYFDASKGEARRDGEEDLVGLLGLIGVEVWAGRLMGRRV